MISIIIPTLDEESHLGHLLEFLEHHTQRDQFETIVVDGNSSDSTIQIAKRFNIDLISTEISSRALQMNEGAKRAKGEILYFVHADVCLVPSFVEDILSAVNQGFPSGCYRFRFKNPKHPLLHINGYFTRFPFKWCRGGDQTLFITNKAFNKVNGYNEKYVIMEDYDLLDRLAEHNLSLKIIPKSVGVSARKYEANSYLKVQLANLKAMKMYKNGEDPSAIKKFYSDTLK